jgi:hypothetical protein
MAYRVYDPVAGRVIISRDVVFDETAQLKWTDGENTSSSDFVIEEQLSGAPDYIIASTPTVQGGASTPTSPVPEVLPKHEPGSDTPRTPTSQSAGTTAPPVFVSPPSSGVSERLDAAHEADVPLRFRPLDHVLESTTPLGPVERVLAE